MSELKKQTVSGVKWLVSSSFLQKAIQTGATIVLARILGPSQFGLFALAFVAIDGLGIFKSMGFDSALIQRRDNVEKAANVAFFVIPALGIILYLVLAVSAPWIGKFLNSQEVVGVIRALGIIFVISCLGRVPTALLEKNMKFRQISIIGIGTAVVYAVSAVTFALLKFGVWSLVYAYILKTLCLNILMFVCSKWMPKFEFDAKIAKEMFHFGKYLFLGGVLWFLKMNLDNILVGKLLGITALGLYAIAFNIANFSEAYFASRVFKVTFPAFSKIQSDKYDLKRAFLKTTKIVSIIAFPLCVGLFLLGGDLIKVLYGLKWVEAIPVIKVLAFAGLLNTLPVAIGPLFNATGNSKSGFWFSFIQVALYLLFIAPAAKFYGLVGVGVVVILSQLTAIIIYLPFVMKLASSNIRDLYLSIRSGLLASLVISGVILGYKYSLVKINFSGINYYLSFSILSSMSLLLYFVSLWFIDRTVVKEIRTLLIKT